MFFEFIIQKKKEYWLQSLFSSLLFAILGIVTGVGVWQSCAIGILLLAVLNIRIHFHENTPAAVGPLIAAVFSVILFCEVQLAVGTNLAQISFLKSLLNIVVVYALILFVASACGSLTGALTGVQVVLILLGVANNLVVQTRGMEIQFSDILSIGTAATVAGDYSYTLPTRTITALLLTVVQILFYTLNRLPKFKKLPLRITGLSTGAVSLILVIALVSTSGGAAAIGFQLKSWKLQPSSYNGFLINLLHSVSATKVDAPEGYSRDELDQLLHQYYPTTTNPSATEEVSPPATTPETIPPTTEDEPVEEKKPNIIVIMNETFSDLTTLADSLSAEMECDTDVLPFFNSLSDDAPNIAKGHALSSVFGGNTANSEFEFLTANSMAFLPANTVAYNLYLNETNAFSVVNILESMGYRTIGMHPEPGSNWSRNRIYGYYGFDETYFLETDENGLDSFVNGNVITEEEMYRGHVSDSTVYNRIIDLYESKEEGESLFTFAVTMQNHGGYNTKDFEYGVHMSSDGSSKSVDEYLTSVQNADAALQELITYFEAQEEETLIVFFGDHQPSLPAGFYNNCLQIPDDSPAEYLQAKYVVPYLYWGNFDFDTEFEQITSINYLSSHMLEIVGIEKPRFLQLMDMVEGEIPAINSFGWWDTDLVFHNFQTEDSDSVNLLRLYKFLQYNRLFDLPEDKLTDWFVLPSDQENIAEDSALVSAGKEDE